MTGLMKREEIAIANARTPRGGHIYVMRMPGSPSREELQEYIRQAGAQLVGAYKIYAGIPSKTGSADGVEFVFKMSREAFGKLVAKAVPIFMGVDLTEWYQKTDS